MLIDEITNSCHNEYMNCVCREEWCTHKDSCSGGCKQCLEEIHYPSRYSNGKRDYDCQRLIYFYMCDYTFKYASEMWYLYEKSESIKKSSKL